MEKAYMTMKNSGAGNIVVGIIILVVGPPAAWVFSKIPFPGRKLLYMVYLVLMVLPFQITMVPNYLVLDKLGLMDTPMAVILPGVFSSFPVFIMKKGYDSTNSFFSSMIP